MRPPDGVPADLALDLAIDGLLEERPGPLPAETAELLATARFLRDRLPRYHPRFRFEEHLAARLMAAGRVAGSPGHLPSPEHAGRMERATPGSRPAAADAGDAGGPSGGSIVWLSSRPGGDASVTETTRRRRGLLAGGAIASGVSLAIPIAGAALVAWRRGRAGGSL